MKIKSTIMLMRTKPITIISTFAFFALSLSSLCAATLVYPFNATFTTTDNSRDIPLSISAPSWTLNESTADTATMNIHSLVGNSNTTGQAAAGWISNELRVGTDYNWQNGGFAWKFKLLDGQTTTGGTITANIRFVGTPSTQSAGTFLGVGQTFVPTSGLLSFNQADFTKVGSASTASYGVYSETWSVNVPTGLSTFFVVFADMSTQSNRADLLSLQTNITAIPEPSTSAMIGIGFSILALSRYKRRAS